MGIGKLCAVFRDAGLYPGLVCNRQAGAIFGSVSNKSEVYAAGGSTGAFITYTVIKSVDTLGPAMANMFIIIAQLVVAYLIELFGMFGSDKVEFEWRKLIGVSIVIIGIVVFQEVGENIEYISFFLAEIPIVNDVQFM
jgi:uncharacterized membrane protein YdcZ (DUF606 family)